MEVIYIGEFYSRENVHWEVQILHNRGGSGSVGLLEFPGTEPLIFEWDEMSKEVPLCGSRATLTLVSPGDRTYSELYTDDPTAVRLDVYRNGALYWSGCMDPEFYEEPYSQKENYNVSLTFSDFGVLDRLRYDLANMRTLQAVVLNALERCNINYRELNATMVSTGLSRGSGVMGLEDLMVRSDNFYDEDGEAMSLKAVIEGVLQPLAMRMVQRDGRVWVYDLNGLYAKGDSLSLRWMSDDQTMGVDKVYNDAKVIWSTYVQSGNLMPTECWGDIETPANSTALNNIDGAFLENGAKYYSYHYSNNLDDWIDATDSGFTLWTSPTGRNAELGTHQSLGMYTRFFKIVPQYDGTEAEGIAVFWRGVAGYRIYDGNGGWKAQYTGRPYGWPVLMGQDTIDRVNLPLFKSSSVWLSPVGRPEDLAVRVTLDMLMDPRFNPFEDAANLTDDGHNKAMQQEDWYKEFEKFGNFVYVPIMAKFQPEGSSDIYVWDNRDIVKHPVDNPIKQLAIPTANGCATLVVPRLPHGVTCAITMPKTAKILVVCSVLDLLDSSFC